MVADVSKTLKEPSFSSQISGASTASSAAQYQSAVGSAGPAESANNGEGGRIQWIQERGAALKSKKPVGGR
jgi:hypothetical protein